MAAERQRFDLAGPLHLTIVDWDNAYHRMSVAASLVRGVYILETDRQEKRVGPNVLAPPWWEFFHFQLFRPLIDDADGSIFGAIYECMPHHSYKRNSRSPRFVIAFRGNMKKANSVHRDIELDIHIFRHTLHKKSRSDMATKAAQEMVAADVGGLNIWLAGHSLGSAIAMLTGKRLAKSGTFIESFLFNPPFVSAPIEIIKHEKLKLGIRIAHSVVTAGLALAMKAKQKKEVPLGDQSDPFAALSAWVPCLFVNPSDHICSEYIGYFEHRKTMEDIGASEIGRLATQNSIRDLLRRALGKESDVVHLIPSASLTVNVTPVRNFIKAHQIDQWWRQDLSLEHKFYLCE